MKLSSKSAVSVLEVTSLYTNMSLLLSNILSTSSVKNPSSWDTAGQVNLHSTPTLTSIQQTLCTQFTRWFSHTINSKIFKPLPKHHLYQTWLLVIKLFNMVLISRIRAWKDQFKETWRKKTCIITWQMTLLYPRVARLFYYDLIFILFLIYNMIK